MSLIFNNRVIFQDQANPQEQNKDISSFKDSIASSLRYKGIYIYELKAGADK